MSKIIFFILMIASFGVFAQTNTMRSIKMDEKSIVKTNEGTVLSYAIWRKLAETNNFSFKLLDSSNPEAPVFEIYRLTDEQKEKQRASLQQRLAKMEKPRPSLVFKEGSLFRFDKMKDMQGNKFDFKKDTSTVVVLNFWFINCPPCKKEIPELNEMVERFKDKKNVVFIAIGLDDEYDIKKFISFNPYSYNLVPEGRFYADKYGVTQYPTHLVIGKDKKVKFSTIGLASNTIYWIEKTINEQL